MSSRPSGTVPQSLRRFQPTVMPSAPRPPRSRSGRRTCATQSQVRDTVDKVASVDARRSTGREPVYFCRESGEKHALQIRRTVMGYRVAVAGATGNVGREMLNILAEREFPVDEIA